MTLKVYLPVVAFTLTAVLLLAQPALAQDSENHCAGRAQEIVQALYPQARKISADKFTVDNASVILPGTHNLDSSNFNLSHYAMMCRQWSARPEYLLVALPMLTTSDDDYPQVRGDIEVLVLDNTSLKPVARQRMVGMIDDSAIAIDQLEFDTAPYRLFDGRVAFGLRVSRVGKSRADIFEQTGLWLFDLTDASLQPVVSGLEVGRNTGLWDGDCAGNYEDIKRILALATEKHQGAADILITTHTKDSDTVSKQNECVESNIVTKTERSRLQYNGRHYVIPKALNVDTNIPD